MSVLGLVFVLGIKGWPVVLFFRLLAAPHAMAIGALSWLVISEIFPTHISSQSHEFLYGFLVDSVFYRDFCRAAAV